MRKLSHPNIREDKVRAAIIGGAIGDALGAPLEGERDFEVLYNKFGSTGVQEYIAPISPFDDKTNFKLGETTDDTASVVGAIAALSLSADKDTKQKIHHLWQANVIWAAHQNGGEKIGRFIDPTIDWPEWYTPFFESTGAGRGTLAALSTGKAGTPEAPLNYNTIIRGKRTRGPNAGCGGMMRVAPIGLLGLDEDKTLDFAIRATAITHGAPEAQAAAAAVALTIRNAFNNLALSKSAEKAIETLLSHKITGAQECVDAFDKARKVSQTMGVSTRNADMIPGMLGYDNHFLAIPVLSQVFYGTLIPKEFKKADYAIGETFLKTLGCVTTISGDSDSVGSIVGNILGARWGTQALPPSLWAGVGNRVNLEIAALSLNRTITEISYEPA